MIRRLTTADAEAYGALRLHALATDAFAFSSSTEEEEGRDWPAFLEGQAAAGDFILGAFEGDRLVAITGFYREKKRKLQHRGGVWGVFVHRDARGKGYSKALLTELVAQAKALPGLRQLHLGVAVGNTPARRVYEALGFVSYGVEPDALWVDGAFGDEELMCLRWSN